MGLYWDISPLAPVSISGLLASLAPTLGYIGKKESAGNSPLCHFLGPEISS